MHFLYLHDDPRARSGRLEVHNRELLVRLMVRNEVDDGAVGDPLRWLELGEELARSCAGSVQEVETEKRLRFELSPLDDQGRALFRVEIDVELEGSSETTVHLAIRVSEADQAAAPMLAGLEPGWSQQLDRLDALLATG